MLVIVRMSPTLYAQDQESAPAALAHALHLADLYNWAGAEQDFSKAEQIFRKSGDERNALYAQLGRIRSRIERDQRTLLQTSQHLAAQLETNPLLQTDKQLRMFCLIVKGDLDTETDPRAMRRDWEQVQSLARDLGDLKWEDRALGQLGMAAFYNGDVATARKDIAGALIAVSKAGDKGAQIRFLSIAGLGLTMVGMYEQALPYLDNALRIAQTIPDAGYPFITQTARLNTLIGLKRFDTAQKVAEEILNNARQTHRGSQEAIALGLLGEIDRFQKKNEPAIAMLDRSAAVSESLGLVRQLAETQNALAEVYRQDGNLPNAERFAELAATSTQASGDLWAVPQRLRTLARIEVDRGEYKRADQVYDRANAFVDSMIGNVSAVLDKTALITSASALYADHFALIADHLHDSRKAYEIIEQVRGRVATDLLMAGSVALPDARREEEELSRLRLKLMGARSTAEVQHIRDEVFLLEQARWVTPDLSILKTRVRKTIRVEQVQQSLPDSSAILEYVVADPHSYCLILTRDTLRVVPLVSGQRIRELATSYLSSIKRREAKESESRELYDLILRPATEALTKQTLLVVPDGPLHLLPFDALMDSSGHYVAEAHTVAYAPSATSFYLLASEETIASSTWGALLGVGGVPYNSGEVMQASVTRGYDVHGLADLPGSRDEVLAAVSALHDPKDKLLLGSEATESAFKRADLPRYDFIHLAVHGLANTTDPDRSALVLLSDPAAGEDGYLQASEVVQLKLNANLVVLSACDTAVGPIQGEEGIATLSRSFLLAGAKSVVSTLWSVDDTFSLFLMKQFYKHLTDQEPAAYALANAKRDVLHRFGRQAVPYYWAAYTFEGAVNRRESVRGNK